jgi:hypothetical protein
MNIPTHRRIARQKKSRKTLDCGDSKPLLMNRRPAASPPCRSGLAHSKTAWALVVLLGLILLQAFCCLRASAQNYSIDWYKIAGGGGTSTGGLYSVSGTIGQPAASEALSGGNFSLTGGFWAIISVVQTPGAPTLYLNHGGNTVTLFWQDVTGWSLIQGTNLTTPVASWSPSSSPTLTGGTNYLILTNPAGNLFFRLRHP